MPAPTYQSQVAPPGPGRMPVIQPADAVGRGLASFGGAVSNLAEAVGRVADYNKQLRDGSEGISARSHYLKGLDELQTKWSESPDYKVAPTEFASAEARLRQEALDMVTDPREREALGFDFERQSIAARGAVHGAARSNEASTAVANLDVADQSYFKRYGSAASDAERQAIMADRDKAIDGLANTGLITPVQAQQRKLTFRATTEQGAVLELIRTDPAKAKALLSDPANFGTIDPFDRQRYLASADAAVEEQTLAGIRAGDDRSSFGAIGRVRDGGTASWIFDRGVIPQESGGRVNTVSPKGALGVSQLMPDTARSVARQMGLADVAALDDHALKSRLLTDADLNRRIGLTYFQGLLDRYDGNVAVALAAYNAGPGNDKMPRATAWRDEAVRRFGPAFTAEEFASVIPITETADYVRSVFGRLGQPMGSTLSATGRFRAESAWSDKQKSDRAAERSALLDLAAISRDDAGDIAKLYGAGYAADPALIASTKQTLATAAAAGDSASALKLRELNRAEQVAPFVASAWRMPPSALEEALSAEESRLATAPVVTPVEQLRLDAMRAVSSEIAKNRDSDPVSVAVRAGRLQTMPLVYDAPPSSSQFQAAFARRGEQATMAAAYLGAPVKPFQAAELGAVKDRWSKLDSGGKAEFVAGLARAMDGRAFTGAVEQMADGAEAHMMIVAGLVGKDRPAIAEQIFRGQELMALPDVKAKAETIKDGLADTLGRLAPDTYPPTVQATIADAATAIYVADRAVGETLFGEHDADAYQSAVEKVTGSFTSINEAYVPAPQGMSALRFSGLFESLTDDDLKAAGGAFGPGGHRFDAAFLRHNAILRPMSLGGSVYGVYLPQGSDLRPVMTANRSGAPLMLDFSALDDLRERFVYEYKPVWQTGERK
ncbi:transglycosylase SLT domain-containing protein [Pleomorphomonas koreensis]|uniref:transglycosylase SLT domain-containing protein n=1 Tax=Pleomorphomonas koreensis TaxID=257440 RepID=UPI0004791316|nr:transglycosylase SLT domain-containing protein [Pleomorphomonas koreensis]